MYKATLFHPEGDSVTDFRNSTTVEQVWEGVNDMGSRWIFYPLAFVTTEKTVIDTPDGLEWMKGKRIATVRQYLADRWASDPDTICKYMNEGWPLADIYAQL